MKTNLLTITLVSLVISACASTPATETTTTPPEQAKETQATPSKVSETAVASTPEVNSSDLTRQLEELQKSSVYFDFSEYVVKPEYRDLISQKADFMKSHGDVVVTLEGNADERGSSEYNLALGNKRANAVLKSLEVLGISASQTRVISLGEEHPRLRCHNEDCWKENRRVDFVVKPGS